MPRGNGTGPGGRGTGGKTGRGRMGGNRPGSGPVGGCVCPKCGKKLPHQRGVPCFSVSCPECGIQMVKAI